MDTKINYGKVISRLFGNPNAVYMIEEDNGFNQELHDATIDDGFWRTLIEIYERELDRFNEKLPLLGARLLELMELRARQHWDTRLSPDNLLHPKNPMGPKSLKALENLVADKEKSLGLKLKRADLLGDTGKAGEEVQQYRQFRRQSVKTQSLIFVKETRELWDSFETRSRQLMAVAQVIDEWMAMDLPKPVILLGDLIQLKPILIPQVPFDSNEGPQLITMGLSSVVMNAIIGGEGRPEQTASQRPSA